MKFKDITLLFFILLVAACTYTVKITDGPSAYDRKQYATAIPMLKKEFDKSKTRSEKGKIAYVLGDAYRRTGQDEAALQWFKTAYDNNAGPEALKAYAYQLKKMERYEEARENFKNLGIEIGSPYEYRKELTACDISIDWKKRAPTSGWQLETLPFNSTSNDFSPVPYSDGRLVFTSDRAGSKGADNYKWTGNRFMDLFIVEPDGASAQNFDPILNSAGNEGTPCFDKNFTQVYFVRAIGKEKNGDAYNKIYWSAKDGDSWATPAPLPFQSENINYLHPALSPDGNTLIFASNDPEGWGGYDLYYTRKNPATENGWETPKLLNRSINSNGNELFPTFDADTLYFASDGLPGMGGLDVFRTYKLDANSWAPPINLKAPLNSGADDFGFIVTHSTAYPKGISPKVGDLLRSGYLSSNRSGGMGGDDIYRFEQRIPKPEPVKTDSIPAIAARNQILLDVYVLEKIFNRPDDPNSGVLGRKPLGSARLQIENGGKKESISVGNDGHYELELAEKSEYNFLASAEGYLNNSAKFSTLGMAKDPKNPILRFEVEIVLDKVFKNQEIVLENIYYDYDKWAIRPDAEPTLKRLAEVLRQNPDIRIVLGSHTDCRGSDAYNQELSQKRAQSAVNYLINQGIDPNRLSAIGYGESQPAANCACTRCTEAEHQTNRRTTFRIVE